MIVLEWYSLPIVDLRIRSSVNRKPVLSRNPHLATLAEVAELRTGDTTGLRELSRTYWALRLVALAVLAFIPWSLVGAAPERVPAQVPNAQVVPEWLSSETAAQLAVGIDVLLPEVVPAPFEGEPAVEASDGYYSLYWLIPGTPPTYLQITGEAGGTIPDYSAYDRNVELVQNAEVQGFPAYHDLTPVYDLVYWQVDNVVYSVESQGLTDTDSLSLANSLAVLATDVAPPESTPGDDSGNGDDNGGGGEVSADPALTVTGSIASGDTVTIDVANATGALLTASSGTFTDTGSDTYESVSDGSYEWQAPNTVEDLYVQFLLIDPDTHDWIATAEATVTGTHAPPTTSLDCPTPVNSGDLVTITLTGGGTVVVNASDGYFPAESPNTDFAPDADGSGTVTGTLLDGATVNLNLQAPDVTLDDAIFVYVSDTDGVTNAQCEIDIIAPEQPVVTPDEGDNGNEDLPNEPPSDEKGVTPPPIEEIPTDEPTSDEGADNSNQPQATSDSSDQGNVSIEGDGTGDIGDVIEADSVSSVEVPTQTVETTSTSKRTSTPKATTTAKATSTPREINTPQPSPTHTPDVSSTGMIAQVIGPEGGQLTHPSGATIIIPPGALLDESTVTIMPVADTNLPVTDRIDFVPATGFDITISDAAGQPVETLAKPATLQLSIAPDKWRRETTLYWIDDGTPEQVDGSQLSESAVSASIGHLSRYAAGVPITGNEDNNRLMYIVAAIVAVIIAGMAFVGFASVRRRRAYSVGLRRVPSRNRKR